MRNPDRVFFQFLQPEISRRTFLKRAGQYAVFLACSTSGLSLGACTGDESATPVESPPPPPSGFHTVSVTLDLTQENYAALQSPGGALQETVIAEGAEFSVILARQQNGELNVFSSICTHAGCMVNPPTVDGIQCPCHGSRFRLDGEVANGPAANPLTPVPVTVPASNPDRVILQFRRPNI